MQNELAQFSTAVRESTLKRLKEIPDGFENWRILKNSLSIAETAGHLLDADHWLFEKLKNESLSPITARSNPLILKNRSEYENILTNLYESGKQRARLIENTGIQKMSRRLYDARFQERVSVWWIIVRGNIDHEIHHRGQLAVYSKMIEHQRK